MKERFGCVEVDGIKIYNTTPHAIKVLDESGEVILEILKATEPLRLREENDYWWKICGISVFRKSFSVTELPPFMPNTYYVVALPVAQIIKRDEYDFIVPHDLVRDSEGNVIGCRAFAFVD